MPNEERFDREVVPAANNDNGADEWITRDNNRTVRQQRADAWGSLFPSEGGDVPDHRGDPLPATYDPRRNPSDRAKLRESGMFRDGIGVSITRGTAHRGVLHPDEYVDPEELQLAVEDNLGFTFEEVRSVYARRGGPVPNSLRQLRDDIDARMLALSRSGANMDLLERLMGLPRMTTSRAVERAKTREGED